MGLSGPPAQGTVTVCDVAPSGNASRGRVRSAWKENWAGTSGSHRGDRLRRSSAPSDRSRIAGSGFAKITSGNAMFNLDDLERASRLVHAAMPPTPQYAWPLLSRRFGLEVIVKHENHTPIG